MMQQPDTPDLEALLKATRGGTVVARNGCVSVTMSGQYQVTAVSLSVSSMDAAERAELEAALATAFNDAIRTVVTQAAESLSALSMSPDLEALRASLGKKGEQSAG